MRAQKILFLTFSVSAVLLYGQNGGGSSADIAPGSQQAVAPATAFGSVSGTVVDENGLPLAQCSVHLENAVPTLFEFLPAGFTDAEGRFQIPRVRPGTYIVGSECRDYPNSRLALYVGHQFQRVTVAAESPNVQVNIVRKDRAGRITNINLVDAVTGKQITRTDPGSGEKIASGMIGIYRADNLTFGIETGVDHSFVFVPAEIPVIIKVLAPGHKPWYSGGAPDPEHAKPLIIKAGEEMSLHVVLQPSPE